MCDIADRVIDEARGAIEEEAGQNKKRITCTVTAYCAEPYAHICNNGNASITATGTIPTPGRTIAVDPCVVPYGTQVVIDGRVYVAEDTGGAIKGNRIDILFSTHSEAMNFGRQTKEVIILVEERE